MPNERNTNKIDGSGGVRQRAGDLLRESLHLNSGATAAESERYRQKGEPAGAGAAWAAAAS